MRPSLPPDMGDNAAAQATLEARLRREQIKPVTHMEDLKNVTGNATDGQALVYSQAKGMWQPGTAGTGQRYATVVVAASNSLHHGTPDADFVCTGSGDQSTINSAIASLPTSGGTVLLMDGTYTLSAPITVNKSNVSLVGMPGWSSVIKTSGFVGSVVISVPNVNNVVIRDLNFAVTGSLTLVQISGGFATFIVAGNMMFSGNIGVQITGTSLQAVITGNFIYSMATGISAGGDGFIIADNYLQSNSTHITVGGSDMTITGNVIEAGGVGIHVGAPGNARSSVTVSGNTTEGCTGNSVELAGAIGAVVTGNSMLGSSTAGQNGIQVSGGKDNTVVGNNVSSHGKANIYLTGSTVDNMVQANTCRQDAGNPSQYGCLIDAASNTNVVVNNDFKTSGTVASFTDNGTGTVKNLDGSANNWNRL